MTMLLLAGMLLPAGAQKFALVDMEYILKNIPAYERANEQLSQTSKKWQAEVEALNQQVQTLYKNYQNELVFLSAEQKKQREEAILAKEKEASDLKKNTSRPKVSSTRSAKASSAPSRTKSTPPSRALPSSAAMPSSSTAPATTASFSPHRRPIFPTKSLQN